MKRWGDVGVGKHSIFLQLGLSLWVNLCPWAVTLTVFVFSPLLLRWDRKTREAGFWHFPSLRSGSGKTVSLVMENRTPWCIPEGLLFPLLTRCMKDDSKLDCEHLVELLEVKLKNVWGSQKTCPTCPMEVLSLRQSTQPPEIHQLLCRFSCFSSSSCIGFCSSKLCVSVFTHLSNLGGSSLPCDLNSLMDLRITDF